MEHRSTTAKNPLKSRLEAGECCLGVWLASGSDAIAELAGAVGFDWCLIDGEHGPNDIPRIEAQLRALAATGCDAVVRVPQGEDWIIKQVLDLGAKTLLVPMVDSAEDASRVARAMRYPPDGHRGMGAVLARASGFGADTDYATSANAGMCCIVQAETVAAMDALDDIARTEGVDGVFIGPADLSADMGYPGQADHPEVVARIEEGIQTIRAAGKPAGIITFDPAQVAYYQKLGVTLLGVGADMSALRSALVSLLAEVRPS